MQAAVQQGGLPGIHFLLRNRFAGEGVRDREGVSGLTPEHPLERLVQHFIAAEARPGHGPVLVGQEDLLLEGGSGEGHVEGELRPLGVQHDGHLVGGLEDPVEGLPLRPVVHHQRVGFQGRRVGVPQLLQKAVQRRLEVLLGHHGAGRKRQQQGKGQEDGVSEEGTDAHGILL